VLARVSGITASPEGGKKTTEVKDNGRISRYNDDDDEEEEQEQEEQ